MIYKCPLCEYTNENKRAVDGHQTIHRQNFKLSQIQNSIKGVAATRQKSLERLKKYNETPSHCKFCKNSLCYEKRSNLFCSTNCMYAYRKQNIKNQECKVPEYLNEAETKEYVHANGSKRRSLSLKAFNRKIDRTPLRDKLVQQFGEKCSICGQLPMWQSYPLTLQVDHIDGNRHNNVLSNLRLLCPNCHSQTPTFCVGNVKKHCQKTIKRIPDGKLLELLLNSKTINKALAACDYAPSLANYKRCKELLDAHFGTTLR